LASVEVLHLEALGTQFGFDRLARCLPRQRHDGGMIFKYSSVALSIFHPLNGWVRACEVDAATSQARFHFIR
jgi:hypothetical protein